MFLLNWHQGFIRNWITLRSHAFRFRNGFIDHSADCSYDKVGILIWMTSGQMSKKSMKPSTSLSVDSNTSLLVWPNLYLVWLVNVFLCGVSIEISIIAAQVIAYSEFGEINTMSSMTVLPFALSICACSSLFMIWIVVCWRFNHLSPVGLFCECFRMSLL